MERIQAEPDQVVEAGMIMDPEDLKNLRKDLDAVRKQIGKAGMNPSYMCFSLSSLGIKKEDQTDFLDRLQKALPECVFEVCE